MAIRIPITPPPSGINDEKLHGELVAMYTDVTGVSAAKGSYYVDLIPDSPVTQEQLQAIVDLHNPAILTANQQEAAQAKNAKTTLQTLMTGLHGLSARDKGYVVLARIIASNDGASTAAILGLTTRANATAYVVTRANWLAVPAAARPMLGDILEAQAVSLSATIAFLTG